MEPAVVAFGNDLVAGDAAFGARGLTSFTALPEAGAGNVSFTVEADGWALAFGLLAPSGAVGGGVVALNASALPPPAVSADDAAVNYTYAALPGAIGNTVSLKAHIGTISKDGATVRVWATTLETAAAGVTVTLVATPAT